MFDISIKAVSSYLKHLKYQELKLWKSYYPSRANREALKYECEYTGFNEYIYPPEIITEEDRERWVEDYEYWIYICGEVDWVEKKQAEILKLISKDKMMRRKVRDNIDYYNFCYFCLMLESSILNINEKKTKRDILEDGIITQIKEYAGFIYKFKN